jgi:transposase InsO family protein
VHAAAGAGSGREHGGISGLCRRAGISRQSYYVARRVRQRRIFGGELALELVREQRRIHPRIGTRKLLWLIRPALLAARVMLGRDGLFALLREARLLVERKRARARTTDSRHSLPVFNNLLGETTVRGPNEAWVSDLTYIRTVEGFLYAALITDVYSRKIVGYDIGDSLEAEGCLRALDLALRALPSGHHPIHHSDRGCQYCCHAYVERLRGRGLPISMTQVMHCYENALAERINGILKQEYEMDRTFRTKQQARKALAQAVWIYNHRRPHGQLAYRTPASVHAPAA